jgi:hypothetical protein
VNNAKTKYFFAIMVFSIDIILACGSHQASMHAILSELSNLYSLRINTLQKEQEQLPSTFHIPGGRATYKLLHRFAHCSIIFLPLS